MAAYRWVYDYACVSLWAWWEVVAANHQVHGYACCHLQADCRVQDQLHSATLDLRVWDLPLPIAFFIWMMLQGKFRVGVISVLRMLILHV